MANDTPLRLLNELAIALGLPKIHFSDDAIAGLSFDDHEVMLIWLEDEQAFLFCSALELPALPTAAARLALYQRLMERNHLMAGASHAAIGIKPDSDILTLTAHWPAPLSAEVIGMGEALLAFVEDVRNLALGLGDWHREGTESESRSYPEDIDPRQFV